MGKLGSGLLIVSNVVGNLACAVGAYYAAANYYGWNAKPVLPSSTIGGHITMPSPASASFMAALLLIMVGLALLVPSWVMLFKVLGRTTEFISSPKEIAPSAASSQRQASKNGTIIDVAPEYLMGLYDGRVHAEGQRLADVYIGKRVTWTRRLTDVRNSESGRTLAVFGMEFKMIQMWFDDQKSIDRLSVARLGEQLTVSGEIVGADSIHVELRNCEVIS